VRNTQTMRTRRMGALPGLVLVVGAFAIVLASGARAHDPPIVSVGAIGTGGNTASGSVGSGAQTDACVNDENSTVDPSAGNANGAVSINTGSCASTPSSSTGAGSTGSTGSSGSAGSTAGAGGATSSAAAAWVSSSEASGLRIVRVRHVTKGVNVTKRFRVLVTLRDARGRYVRNAIVSVSHVPSAASTVSGVHSAFSNRSGQATIAVPVTKNMLGKRLFLKIGARTPSARAVTLRSVQLPALG
jgi:hypothetical protein